MKESETQIPKAESDFEVEQQADNTQPLLGQSSSENQTITYSHGSKVEYARSSSEAIALCPYLGGLAARSPEKAERMLKLARKGQEITSKQRYINTKEPSFKELAVVKPVVESKKVNKIPTLQESLVKTETIAAFPSNAPEINFMLQNIEDAPKESFVQLVINSSSSLTISSSEVQNEQPKSYERNLKTSPCIPETPLTERGNPLLKQPKVKKEMIKEKITEVELILIKPKVAQSCIIENMTESEDSKARDLALEQLQDVAEEPLTEITEMYPELTGVNEQAQEPGLIEAVAQPLGSYAAVEDNLSQSKTIERIAEKVIKDASTLIEKEDVPAVLEELTNLRAIFEDNVFDIDLQETIIPKLVELLETFIDEDSKESFSKNLAFFDADQIQDLLLSLIEEISKTCETDGREILTLNDDIFAASTTHDARHKLAKLIFEIIVRASGSTQRA